MRTLLSLIPLLTLCACGDKDDTASDPGLEPASAVMLASAQWVWVGGERWFTYQRALIPLVFMADADTRATGARSEHCRVMGAWTDQEEGLSPLSLSTSLLDLELNWNPDGYYDIDGLEGDDPFTSSGDTLTLTGEGVEASVGAPSAMLADDVLGAEAGFNTPIYAEGFDYVWSWITGSETVGSIYCMVPVDELEVDEEGRPWGPAVPQDGQDLWGELGFESEELMVGLVNSVEVDGVWSETSRLMAGRVYKMAPE
jgi:hypothetical protein